MHEDCSEPYTIHSKTHTHIHCTCRRCLPSKMQSHCAKEMQNLWMAHFPNHNVTKITNSPGSCLEENGQGHVSLLLWICPNEGGNGMKLEQITECSGRVPDEHLKPCSYFTSQSLSTLEIVLIAVLGTLFVFVVLIILLLLGVLVCWKWKNVKTFAKRHCTVRCR